MFSPIHWKTVQCLNSPCRSLTFPQWKNPWGLWSKYSSWKEYVRCSFPESECTPTGHSSEYTSMLGVNLTMFVCHSGFIKICSKNLSELSCVREKTDSSKLCSESQPYNWSEHRATAATVVPSEPAGCGWSLQSPPKCFGRCCSHLCHAHCQPSPPMRIYRGACKHGRYVVGQSGG